MLVLGRKSLEALVIGSNVRITVLKVDRNNVRLGIEAPGETSVVRAELLERQANAERIAKAGPPSSAVIARE